MIKKIAIVLGFILSAFLIFITTKYDFSKPKKVFSVYLDGKKIGLTKSKDKLEEYIDKEQNELKEQYNIDKVYTPKGLDVVKELTYERNISSTKKIYEEIKDIKPFTINGYMITIKGIEKETNDSEEQGKTEDKVIYVLDKKIFTDSVKNFVKAFVTEETYTEFANNTQKEITDTGKITENIYIQNDIVIEKGNIPANETIYTSVEDLSKYLLFGTLEKQRSYTVKEGDTIADVAFDNKLSVEEFLIANTQFSDENNMLYAGQEVTLGVLKPQLNVVEEQHVVEIQPVKYRTKIEYDNSLLVGTVSTKQKGINGSNKVTKKLKLVNGETTTAIITDTEELTSATDEIVIRGGASGATYGNSGYWGWPTRTPYTISSPYGYRWGFLHDGMDIAGCGYGSPIYAANNGIVVKVASRWPDGNFIIINHNNGYYTEYAHLKSFNVREGQVVSTGDVIAAMGLTGNTSGTHLHFGVFKGGMPYGGGRSINPLTLYR